MAVPLPKGGLVGGHDKPIHESVAPSTFQVVYILIFYPPLDLYTFLETLHIERLWGHVALVNEKSYGCGQNPRALPWKKWGPDTFRWFNCLLTWPWNQGITRTAFQRRQMKLARGFLWLSCLEQVDYLEQVHGLVDIENWMIVVG